MEFSLRNGIDLALTALWWIVLLRVLASWFDREGRYAATRLVHELSEPILAPLRRILPGGGSIDWSPLVAMLALQFLRRLV
ncbi:MAG: YggT family protein [Chloroflexi bacterium]|jgi:YggT family protein|nr:MAG: YggT family protein [Chloroflexota bacterium]